MKRKINLSIIALVIFCSTFLVNSSEIDLSRYDQLYKKRQFETITRELNEHFRVYTEWIGPKISENQIIRMRNILADSYRMTNNFYEACKWYAMTIEGYGDIYAKYCFEIITRTSSVVGKTTRLFQCVPYSNYDGRLGSNPSRESTLIRILSKLTDDTPLKDKQTYFSQMVLFDKNNDWVTKLTRFCAGDIDLEELLTDIPKENTGTVLTYAALSLEMAGNILEARNLYQSALSLQKTDNIEMLLAAHRMGLLALKMIYTTTTKSNNYTFNGLADVYLLKASSAKIEDDRLYSIYNIIDDDTKTAWVPVGKNGGCGEWIEILFGNMVSVKELCITNGYAKSDASFNNNNRVKRIVIEFCDGTKKNMVIKDTSLMQTIKVQKTTSSIRLYITEIYKGMKYDDTCMTAIDINFN